MSSVVTVHSAGDIMVPPSDLSASVISLSSVSADVS